MSLWVLQDQPSRLTESFPSDAPARCGPPCSGAYRHATQASVPAQGRKGTGKSPGPTLERVKHSLRAPRRCRADASARLLSPGSARRPAARASCRRSLRRSARGRTPPSAAVVGPSSPIRSSSDQGAALRQACSACLRTIQPRHLAQQPVAVLPKVAGDLPELAQGRARAGVQADRDRDPMP